MARNKLPADFALTALSDEALRRHTTYGKLVAAITSEERERIVEAYRQRHTAVGNRTKFHEVTRKNRPNGKKWLGTDPE